MHNPGDRSSFSTIELTRHLWRRRYLLLFAPIIFVILGYVYVRSTMGQFFESSAMLRIRTPPSGLRQGPSVDRMEPPTYEDIFLSPELIRSVVDDARKKFPDFPQDNFESLRKWFETKVITTRETVVAADYAPILTMRAQGLSREQAYFLMDTWLKKGLEKFGELRSGEAREYLSVFQKDYDAMIVEVEKVQAGEEQLRQQLVETQKMLDAKYALLDGSADVTGGDSNSKLRGGLYAEKVRLELDLAQADGGPVVAGALLSGALKARLDRANGIIEETLASIKTLGEAQVSMSRDLGKAREQLLMLREKIEQAREVIVMATTDAQVLADPLNPGVKGDFSVLAWPVKPEKTISPSRGLLAIGIGILLSSFLVLLLVIEFFVRTALREET